MEFWYTLSGICAVIVLIPHIRCFFKRVTCRAKIKKICRRKGYCLHPTHPLWFLGHKCAKKCDLYIETANEVFAVKLFSVPSRYTILIFTENGNYYIRKFLAFVAYGTRARIPINGRQKPIPMYDFRYRYRDEWEIKIPRHILLVNPVSLEFRLQPQHGKESIIDAGNIINGMEIDSLPRLLGDLESAL